MSETLPPLTDERTPHLDLPLPSLNNWQQQDVPRLRESFVLLDIVLQFMSLDLAGRPTGTEFQALSQAVAARLPLAGGTMTGPLVLAAAPTADMHPATRKYVDDGAGGRVRRRVVTAAETVQATERGNLLDCDGSFALSFADVAQLGNGWWCRVRNIGAGDVPLSAAAGQLIDGLSSYVMYPKECRLVICHNGTLVSIVLAAFFKVFPSSANYTEPPGYAAIEGDEWGAGGGGGGANGTASSYSGAGGAGGAHEPIRRYPTVPGSVHSIVIGAGGIGGNSVTTASGATAGSAGGDSTAFGVVAKGGGGGAPAVASHAAANAGALSSADEVAPTNGGRQVHGGGGGGGSSPLGGGASLYGGGGGGAGNDTVAAGGPSTQGGKGGNGGVGTTVGGAVPVAPANGEAPGGGGGGCGRVRTAGIAYKAGDGARGETRLWGVI